MKRPLFVLLGLLIAVVAAATLTLSESLQDDSNYPLPVDREEYGEEWFWSDTDGDGTNDYAFRLNDRGDLWYEVMDFNGDGKLDNFYYRQAGVLVQQELDTNFDGLVDLWVLMEDGIHVRGYMRDTDFDGSVDVEKDYGE